MNDSVLQMLREKNPNLPLYSVLDEQFAPYGRVLGGRDGALSAALDETGIPAEGNVYFGSVPELGAVPCMEDIRRIAFGGMPTQSGFCNGRGYTMDAMEYHKCSEVNYSTTGAVLLLALQSDLKDFTMDSSSIVGFYLPPETLVEVFPGTRHFAPCRIRESGFRCLVVLEQGVNTDLPHVDTAAPGEEKTLWMRGKWMLCHPDSPQAKNGAFIGISGENLALNI